jgi:plasmid stability protein
MPALLIKDLPAALHQRLKLEAEKHHRSMTKEALCLLEQGLSGSSHRSLRDVTPIPSALRVDDAWIKRAKSWGRT